MHCGRFTILRWIQNLEVKLLRKKWQNNKVDRWLYQWTLLTDHKITEKILKAHLVPTPSFHFGQMTPWTNPERGLLQSSFCVHSLSIFGWCGDENTKTRWSMYLRSTWSTSQYTALSVLGAISWHPSGRREGGREEEAPGMYFSWDIGQTETNIMDGQEVMGT